MIVGILFIGVGVVDGKIEIVSLSHLALLNDLTLEIPDRDSDALKDDPLEVLLGFESIVDVTRHDSSKIRLRGT